MDPAASQVMKLHANAKVNLCLSVQFPPHDGYHQARSVFQELDLHDVIRVKVESLADIEAPESFLGTSMGTSVGLACAVDGLVPRDNLVFRALDMAEQACNLPLAHDGQAVRIDIEKHIPAGGGLGGGSSDAAAMLRGYAMLAGVDAHDARLVRVARSLGADVAFFLQGGCALMGGRGDVFERALPPLALPVVLMGDGEGMSTAAVYRAFDEDPVAPPDADALAALLDAAQSAGMQGEAVRLCANNLGPAACSLNARLRERIETAREHPAVLAALVSGSGSTSFAICDDIGSARRFARDIAPLCDWVRICACVGNRPQE